MPVFFFVSSFCVLICESIFGHSEQGKERASSMDKHQKRPGNFFSLLVSGENPGRVFFFNTVGDKCREKCIDNASNQRKVACVSSGMSLLFFNGRKWFYLRKKV